MKIKKILLLGLAVLFVSCNQSSVYRESFDFDKNQWKKSDAKTFEFTIDNDIPLYDIKFSLSHVYDYQFASVPLSFKWIKPDGTTQDILVDLKIKDENGKDLGECAGDICDINHVLESNVKLQKGKHKIVVSNSFDFPYLPNIIQIGMELNSAKE